MGVRITGNMQSIVGVGGGNNAALANQVTLHTLSTGKRAVIRKLRWCNRTGANVNIWIGYGDLTVAASVFRQTMPDILAVNGVDGELTEEQIPLNGNMPQGFAADTTAITGSNGNILAEASNAAADPADVQIIAEVEEF